MPRLSKLTVRDVQRATASVRRYTRAAEEAALRGDRAGAYQQAELAQGAAFNLKQLFVLSEVELEVGKEILG